MSFNPYFKWICFLIEKETLKKKYEESGFNPCFKWIGFLILIKVSKAKYTVSFNPYFKWICFLMAIYTYIQSFLYFII